MADLTHLYNGSYKFTSTTQIRLLEILPGAQDTPVETQLRLSDLKDRPKYEALSYVWGEASIQGPQIFMNEVEVGHAHENLRYFLYRIRNPNKIRTVWVDALCINQQDYDEKARQIQLMGQIYQQAQCVLGWLGEHDETSIRVFGTTINDRLHNAGLKGAHLIPPYLPAMVIYDSIRRLKMKNDKTALIAWKALLTRPYFNRTWILQEMLLAKKIQFVCGPDTMSMTLFEKPLRHFRLATSRNELADVLPRSFLIYFAKRSSNRVSRKEQGYYFEKRDIFELVHEFQFTNCTNLLDRVYAMLSLEAPSKTTSIRPDYHINVYELFVRICVAKLPHEISEATCKRVAMLFTGLRLDKNIDGEEDDHVKHQNAEAIITSTMNRNVEVQMQCLMIRAFDVFGFLKPRRNFFITSSDIPDQITVAYRSWKKTESARPDHLSSSINFRKLDEPIWGRYETFREGQRITGSQPTANHALHRTLMHQTIQHSSMSRATHHSSMMNQMNTTNMITNTMTTM